MPYGRHVPPSIAARTIGTPRRQGIASFGQPLKRLQAPESAHVVTGCTDENLYDGQQVEFYG
jgi:hypothetical protein